MVFKCVNFKLKIFILQSSEYLHIYTFREYYNLQVVNIHVMSYRDKGQQILNVLYDCNYFCHLV